MGGYWGVLWADTGVLGLGGSFGPHGRPLLTLTAATLKPLEESSRWKRFWSLVPAGQRGGDFWDPKF